VRHDTLAGLRFSVAGPGRVGASLARWLLAAGARCEAVAGRRTGGAAARLAGALDARPLPLGRLATSGEDLLLVALPDGALPAAAAALGRRPQAGVVLHCSGSRGAEVLAPLRAKGSAVGTLHPLKAFPRPLPDSAEAVGVCFALDGDPKALALGRRLVARWRGEAALVPAGARAAYHLGASLAAGGAVTLLAAAAELAERLGLPAAVGRGYGRLAAGAVAGASAGDPALALTGPVARGEAALVRAQLAALRRWRPDLVPLVVLLGLETLRQLERRGPLGRERLLTRRALERSLPASLVFLDP
jgi:predicted short-subunit dehydrogenase-like oxidoreductase (DUF2520 family)